MKSFAVKLVTFLAILPLSGAARRMLQDPQYGMPMEDQAQQMQQNSLQVQQQAMLQQQQMQQMGWGDATNADPAAAMNLASSMTNTAAPGQALVLPGVGDQPGGVGGMYGQSGELLADDLASENTGVVANLPASGTQAQVVAEGIAEPTTYDIHVQPAMDAMNKHLMPQLEKHGKQLSELKDQATVMIGQAHGKMTNHLAKLTGHQEVPEWLRLTAFVMLLFPFAIWVLLLAYFLTQLASAGLIFTLAKCGNLFWTIYCLFLAIMTFVISEEPLFFFHQNHPSEYIAFQFIKAGLFAIHLIVLLFQCVNDMSFLNLVQWIGSTMIGVHYYFNAWHLAMMEQAPVLGFKYYAFYMYCFFIFFILPQSNTNKGTHYE
mmetsp:Transcript_20307/g.24286  ORF Transcript_20307/g.24286 Transcript_20307/m.24286 type:complete len:375 (-) Transcript_20307:896-2020(-)